MAQSGIATALGWRGDDPNSLVVPPAPNVDTTKAAGDAIAGNITNLPKAEQLAGKTNEATARQFLAMMERIMPGFGEISKTIAGNIKSQVSGELPSDVEAYIGRKAAEKGIVRGTGGSQFDKYGALRDLGLTSLELTDRGLNSAQRWMASVSSGAPTFNVTSMFISPAQRIATEQWNEVNRYNAQFLRNQIKMLPSNAEMAGAQILDYVATWATTAASMGTSSMMGGGGGGGQQQVPQYNNYGQNSLIDYSSFGTGGGSAPSYNPPVYNPPPYNPGGGSGTMQPGGWGAP